MLAQFTKPIVVNNSGQTVTYNNNGRLNLKRTAIHFNTTDGKVVYTPLADDDLGFIAASSLADGAEIEGSEIDNTSNLYVGMQFQIEVTHDEGTAADGTFDLYLDGGDATGELASDASGYASAEANKLEPIGALTWESNGQDDELMRSNVIEI